MTLLTTGDGASILRPEDVQALVVEPLQRDAVALQVATLVTTASTSTRFPVVQSDPTTAWTAEGDDIDISDAELTEIDCVPKALKGLTLVSSELAEDSDPSALAVVGAGLVRDLQVRLDAAFFGNTTVNGPNGLESLAGVQPVTGTDWDLTNLDMFARAISLAEQVGSTLTAFVANPTDMLTLTTSKVASGWEQPLMGPDPTSPTNRSAQGVPLHWSPAVPQGTIWGLPKAKCFAVLRLPVTLESDRSAYFGSDRIAIRCKTRFGFAFPHPAAIIKLVAPGS